MPSQSLRGAGAKVRLIVRAGEVAAARRGRPVLVAVLEGGEPEELALVERAPEAEGVLLAVEGGASCVRS